MAHRLLVTGHSADFPDKATDFYSPQAEGALLWSDPAIGIDWSVLDVAPNWPPRTPPPHNWRAARRSPLSSEQALGWGPPRSSLTIRVQ